MNFLQITWRGYITAYTYSWESKQYHSIIARCSIINLLKRILTNVKISKCVFTHLYLFLIWYCKYRYFLTKYKYQCRLLLINIPLCTDKIIQNIDTNCDRNSQGEQNRYLLKLFPLPEKEDKTTNIILSSSQIRRTDFFIVHSSLC